MKGQVIQRFEYAAFGRESFALNPNLSWDPAFTGQRYDIETGLYYYRARYYNPILGRFIQPDTIVQNPFDPQSWNRYAYVRNNPLKYVDPSGHIIDIVLDQPGQEDENLRNHPTAVTADYRDNGPSAENSIDRSGGGRREGGLVGAAIQQVGSIIGTGNIQALQFVSGAIWDAATLPLRALNAASGWVGQKTGCDSTCQLVTMAVLQPEIAAAAAGLGYLGPWLGTVGRSTKSADTIAEGLRISTHRFTGPGEVFVRYESGDAAFSRVTSSGVKSGTHAAPLTDGLVPLADRASVYNLPDANIPRAEIKILSPPEGTLIIGPRPVAGGTGNEVLFPLGFKR